MLHHEIISYIIIVSFAIRFSVFIITLKLFSHVSYLLYQDFFFIPCSQRPKKLCKRINLSNAYNIIFVFGKKERRQEKIKGENKRNKCWLLNNVLSSVFQRRWELIIRFYIDAYYLSLCFAGRLWNSCFDWWNIHSITCQM